MSSPEIEIKAQAKHNAYSLIIIGFSLFFTVLIFSQNYWQQAKLILILLLLVSFVIIFLGITKHIEPLNSFKLTPDKLTYHHKYGHWKIIWKNIRRIAQVKETVGIEYIELPYIGIKLESLMSIIDNISPRLASRLIHEQRPLIYFCLQHRLLTLEQVTINFSPFKFNDITIKGPVAAFLYQTSNLHKALGYHLYIPENSIDRPCQDFVDLLNNCKVAARNYEMNEN